MRAMASLLLFALACRQAEEPVPATAAAPPTTTTPVAAPAPPAGAMLGGALNASPGEAAAQSTIVIAKDGKPVVAWRERAMIHVKKWDGTAWQPLGAALDRDPEQNGQLPQLVATRDGSIVCFWREYVGGHERLFASAWSGSEWAPLGAEMNAPATHVVEYAAADSGGGAAVVFIERDDDNGTRLVVRRWNGTAWQQLGGGALNAVAGSEVREPPAIAPLAGNDLAVAWLERVPAGPLELHLRRWDDKTNGWRALPSPGEVDADSDVFMTSIAGGTLVLGRTWNGGLRPYVTLANENEGWKPIGLPNEAMHHGGGMPVRQVVPAPKGVATLTWWQGALQLASWNGAQWKIIAPSVNPEVHKGWDADAAVAPDGTAYVSYVDTRTEPSQVFVQRYKP